MKVRITELKAPWPQGARVGDVVEIAGDTLPGWAVGKSALVDDDTEAQHEYLPEGSDGLVQADGSVTFTREQLQELSARMSEQREMNASQGKTIEQLIEDVKTGSQEEAALREQLAAAQSMATSEKARADDLQVQLDEAKKAATEVASAATAKAAKK